MALRSRIGRYELHEVLGTGAMGAVYSAWDPKLHREVALKLVSRDLASVPKVRTRFQREARAIAALRHPNIVEIYDYSGEESDSLYLVMEKLEGDDLFNIVDKRGGMPEAAAAAVGHEICLALQVAHDSGIIHRDLKPENVFIDTDGRVVLTDFGIVKAVKPDSAVDGFSAKTDVIGTPGFMPPELMMNKPLGPYTDVFALGALMYNITTGCLPFDGPTPVDMFRAMVTGQFEDPRKYNRLISDDFHDLLGHMLEPKPKNRPQDVQEVREGFKLILEDNGVTDLRDDLRDYMQDPDAYTDASTARLADNLVQRIKIALKDHNDDLAADLRERLELVDPDNNELDSVTGFMPVLQTGRENRRSSSSARRRSGGGGKWVMISIMVAVVAIALALYFTIDFGGDVTPENENVNNTNEAPTQPLIPEEGQLEITIKGGQGVIFVDGERVGRGRKRSLTLPVGEHVVEVRGRGNRLKETVTLEVNRTIVMSADIRRGTISHQNRITKKN